MTLRFGLLVRLGGAAFILALAGCASVLAPLAAPRVETEATALRAGQYELDPEHASLIFRINHLGFSDYVGRFEVFDATLDFDADKPEAARVDAAIDIASLDVANKAFAETLKGPQWFDAAQFPEARFQSTGIRVTGANEGVLTGTLTLHGTTAPVDLRVVFNGGARDRLRGGAYVVGFSAAGAIDRTAFGIDRFSGVIADEVRIEIEAEFIRQSGD